MANELPYFPFYPADFFGDENVRLMDPYEIGVYLMLLCHQWQQGSIPADLEILAKLLRLPIEGVKSAWPAISPCFTVSGEEGRLVQPRLQKERQRSLERGEQAKKAAATRWSGRNADALPTHSDRNAEPDATAMLTEQNRTEQSIEITNVISPGKRLRPSFPAVDFGELEGDLTAFFAAAAAERKSGTIAESIVVRLRHELAALRTELANDAAFLHGLRAATAKGADNVTYVRKAAGGFEAPSRPRPITSKYQEVSDIQRKLAADRQKREAV